MENNKSSVNGKSENGKWNLHDNWKRFRDKKPFGSNALTKSLHSQNTDKKSDSSYLNDNKGRKKKSIGMVINGKIKSLQSLKPLETTDVEKCQFIRGSHLRSPLRTKRKQSQRSSTNSKLAVQEEIQKPSKKQAFSFLPLWKGTNLNPITSSTSSPSLSTSSFSPSMNTTPSLTRLSDSIIFLDYAFQ